MVIESATLIANSVYPPLFKHKIGVVAQDTLK